MDKETKCKECERYENYLCKIKMVIDKSVKKMRDPSNYLSDGMIGISAIKDIRRILKEM